MQFNNKILSLDELKQAILKKSSNSKIVLCHGHFNIIHPGHLRFLQNANEQGDILLVAVHSDNYFRDRGRKNFFKQEDRASGVAALLYVDFVIILDETSLEQLIDAINPHIYMLGKEFESKRAYEVKKYSELVNSYQGKVIYSSGDVQYASIDFLYQDEDTLNVERLKKFKEVIARHKIDNEKLLEYIDKFSSLNMVVIGDTIVDQYVACDALGMSAEAPVIAVKEMESKEFIGGAAVVAAHVKSLGANCHFISVTGNDDAGKFVEKELNKQNTKTFLVRDEGRPTTFKIRYMVNNQKLFRVSRLQERSISKEYESIIIEKLEELAPSTDGIIVSDFVYGVITERLLKEIVRLANKHNILLFGDLQCSSQIGNVLKFKDFNFICPTEREARIALSDHESGLELLAMEILKQSDIKNLLITLGPKGFLSYQQDQNQELSYSQHFPALVSNPVDVAGAGDSLLSGISTSLVAGASLMEASVIGTCIAAMTVNQMGNIPVSKSALFQVLQKL